MARHYIACDFVCDVVHLFFCNHGNPEVVKLRLKALDAKRVREWEVLHECSWVRVIALGRSTVLIIVQVLLILLGTVLPGKQRVVLACESLAIARVEVLCVQNLLVAQLKPVSINDGPLLI